MNKTCSALPVNKSLEVMRSPHKISRTHDTIFGCFTALVIRYIYFAAYHGETFSFDHSVYVFFDTLTVINATPNDLLIPHDYEIMVSLFPALLYGIKPSMVDSVLTAINLIPNK